jgi:hypothetical protein
MRRWVSCWCCGKFSVWHTAVYVGGILNGRTVICTVPVVLRGLSYDGQATGIYKPLGLSQHLTLWEGPVIEIFSFNLFLSQNRVLPDFPGTSCVAFLWSLICVVSFDSANYNNRYSILPIFGLIGELVGRQDLPKGGEQAVPCWRLRCNQGWRLHVSTSILVFKAWEAQVGWPNKWCLWSFEKV